MRLTANIIRIHGRMDDILNPTAVVLSDVEVFNAVLTVFIALFVLFTAFASTEFITLGVEVDILLKGW